MRHPTLDGSDACPRSSKNSLHRSGGVQQLRPMLGICVGHFAFRGRGNYANICSVHVVGEICAYHRSTYRGSMPCSGNFCAKSRITALGLASSGSDLSDMISMFLLRSPLIEARMCFNVQFCCSHLVVYLTWRHFDSVVMWVVVLHRNL